MDNVKFETKQGKIGTLEVLLLLIDNPSYQAKMVLKNESEDRPMSMVITSKYDAIQWQDGTYAGCDVIITKWLLEQEWEVIKPIVKVSFIEAIKEHNKGKVIVSYEGAGKSYATDPYKLNTLYIHRATDAEIDGLWVVLDDKATTASYDECEDWIEGSI